MLIGYSKEGKHLLVIPDINETVYQFDFPWLKRKVVSNKCIFHMPVRLFAVNALRIDKLINSAEYQIQCSPIVRADVKKEIEKIADIKRRAVEQKAAREKIKAAQIADWNAKRGEIIRANAEELRPIESIKARFWSGDSFAEMGETQLMNHQKAGLLISDYSNRFAFFFDTGTGKTALALNIIQRHQQKSRFLIICPKNIIQAAWIDNCLEFTPRLRLLPLCTGISKISFSKIMDRNARIVKEDGLIGGISQVNKHPEVERLMKKLDIGNQSFSMGQHYITNPEYFIHHFEAFQRLGITGLIFDESAKLKNNSTKLSHAIQKLAKKMKYVYFLSGKPAPNTTAEYYTQMRIIDPFSIDMSYKRFKNRSFIPAHNCYEYSQHTNQSGYQATDEEMADVLGCRSLTVSKEDCFDLPEKTYVIKSFALKNSTYQEYRKMEQVYSSMVTTAKNEGKVISVANHLAAIRKLQQIASGFLMDAGKEKHILEHGKLSVLANVLDELCGKQVLIWCQYKHEINTIVDELKAKGHTVVTANSDTADVNASIEAFKSGEAQYLVAHPKSLMYGVTLTNCSYAIYYSISYSFEELYQSHDRIYRYGQSLPCTYFFLQAEGTIDRAMYNCVMRKQLNTEIFEALIKDIEQHQQLSE